MRTTGWTDDSTSYPLAYEFFYSLTGGDGATVLGAGTDGSAVYLNPTNGSATTVSILPVGTGEDFNITVGVTITDSTEASASASALAYALPPTEFDGDAIRESTESSVNLDIIDGSYISAATTISSGASVVNYVLGSSTNQSDIEDALELRSAGSSAHVLYHRLLRSAFINFTADLISQSTVNEATVESQSVVLELVARTRPEDMSDSERSVPPNETGRD